MLPSSYNDFRKQLLLANNKTHQQEYCFNQVWYNLLLSNNDNWQQLWSHNLSELCQKTITDFFKQKNIKGKTGCTEV